MGGNSFTYKFLIFILNKLDDVIEWSGFRKESLPGKAKLFILF
jgi:hypothetical protein